MNTPKQNLEFQITFTETNLRWLAGATNPDNKKINKTIKLIEKLKKKLGKMG